MTTAPTLSAPVNLRDLGGIPIEGGVLRPGLAIRTDDIAYVTEDIAERLVADGLTAIIDLRSPLEVAITGRGPLAHYPTAYHHLPLIADVVTATPKDSSGFSHEAMGEMYLAMVEDAASQLVTALNVIAHTPGTTAFHCAAGRDRTGVLAAMLLLTLGAADADIIADYARTGDNMRAILERNKAMMGAMWKAIGFDAAAPNLTALLEGRMDVAMQIALATLRERHGDALGPLRAAGLSDDTIARLRNRALAA
ncbi:MULTISPECIES: tyrosine-protein phosphatase [Rhodococcus]|uniref:tyrosine-protein phosphatase n=1 Tax=Rhodococcus TaxID=1827 RepID=UPI00193B687E|nr:MULTISPECIES: tyrosine-protein phosphatase [Rhodococcus]QRI79243.1 tyrosine-protein phosphatase [Rhodococcus aetherivorans]QSE62428.1 tyrosine-protein phosphatase [Rhodococcus sp. PSBB066]